MSILAVGLGGESVQVWDVGRMRKSPSRWGKAGAEDRREVEELQEGMQPRSSEELGRKHSRLENGGRGARKRKKRMSCG